MTGLSTNWLIAVIDVVKASWQHAPILQIGAVEWQIMVYYRIWGNKCCCLLVVLLSDSHSYCFRSPFSFLFFLPKYSGIRLSCQKTPTIPESIMKTCPQCQFDIYAQGTDWTPNLEISGQLAQATAPKIFYILLI